MDSDTYDFSWGGPLLESNRELVGKLNGKLPERWLLTSFSDAGFSEHDLEQFQETHPDCKTWDNELHRENNPAMMWSYALLHRSSGTIFITISER